MQQIAYLIAVGSDISATEEINPLSKITNFTGAFEISLVYTGGKHTQKNANLPCYIIN